MILPDITIKIKIRISEIRIINKQVIVTIIYIYYFKNINEISIFLLDHSTNI